MIINNNFLNLSIKMLVVFSMLIMGQYASADIQPFSDVTIASNINHTEIASPYRSTGGGVAWIDIDNDGYQDLYITSPAVLVDPGDPPNSSSSLTGNYLYHNVAGANGKRIFQLLINSGAEDKDHVSSGVASGDYNGDGCDDLYVANGKFTDGNVNGSYNALLRNNFCVDGTLTFTDVTVLVMSDIISPVESRTDDKSNSAVAAFGDIDLDGDLDLYVGNTCKGGQSNPNVLYINNSGTVAGNFLREESGGFGVEDPGCTLGVTLSDFDNDGDLDIITTNDFSQQTTLVDGVWVNLEEDDDKVYRNLLKETGILQFRNDASIVNFSDTSNGMGIAPGDFNNDGLLDYYSSSMVPQTGSGGHVFNVNFLSGVFQNLQQSLGIIDAAIDPNLVLNVGHTGWGTVFFDADNDGYVDLYLSNGVIEGLNGTVAASPNRLYQNNQGASFIEVGAQAAVDGPIDLSACPDLADGTTCYAQSRGVAAADYDNDGDEDLFVINMGNWGNPSLPISAQQPGLYESQAQNNANHWLQVKLQGSGTNPRGVGAKIRLITPDNVQQLREISAGSSHGSTNSMVASFGIGSNTAITSLSVEWPGGCIQAATPYESQIDQLNIIREINCGGIPVSGQVVDSSTNAGIPGVELTIISFNTTEGFTVNTDSQGNYSTAVPATGPYLVNINKSGYRFLSKNLPVSGSVTRNFSMQATETFRTKATLISAYTNTPVAGVLLSTQVLNDPGTFLAYTDARGEFSADLPVSGGLYILNSLSNDYEVPLILLFQASPERTKRVTPVGLTISGIVTDANTGLPLAGVDVAIVPEFNGEVAFPSVLTDTNGRYTVVLPLAADLNRVSYLSAIYAGKASYKISGGGFFFSNENLVRDIRLIPVP